MGMPGGQMSPRQVPRKVPAQVSAQDAWTHMDEAATLNSSYTEVEEWPQAPAVGDVDPLEMLGVKLDQMCTDALKELPPDQQMAILKEVNLDNVRNPSAFVWSKIKLART